MGEKIFVVDDDVSDQEFLAMAFTEIAFHSVEFFSNVFSIVQKLKTIDASELPKLIITDYQMPSLDGFNLVTFLKKNARLSSIKVVILTGSIAENEKHRLVSAGVTKILLKPNSPEGYKSMVSELRELVN
jgi:CheY-like chemotaxis protein